MSKIYLINGSTTRAVDNLITAHVRDSLDGEFTLSFTATDTDAAYINDDTTVSYNGQYFTVASYLLDTEGQSPICAVECEHISYQLNDAAYDLDGFTMTGTPAALLTSVLSGTPFSVGTVEVAQARTVAISGAVSRRALLYTLAGLVGGEIEYNGYAINLRLHRGSTAYIELTDTYNVTRVSKERNVRENLTSYNVALGRKTILAAGDNVHIVNTRLGIDVNTRIIAIDYNPYRDSEADIEVGDYVPDIVDSYASLSNDIKDVKQEFTVSNGQLNSRISTAEGDISSLEQTANILTSSISAANGSISTLQQTANKIDWLVASGTTAANFTMTSRAIQQVAENINLTGYVTIAALSGSGTTTINGDNITTGNISADRIAANNNSAYITFNSPLYLNAAYPQIYGLDALYFGPDHDCAIVGNNSNYSGANTIQLRAPGGLFHYDGVAVRTVLTSGNIASYITFQ